MAALGERLGFDLVGIADTPGNAMDLWVALGVAAAHTERVPLAACVTNFVSRHPLVTASAATSLAAVCGGRFMLGVGTGHSAAVSAGARPSTPSAFREALALTRTRLAGRVPLYAAGSGPGAAARRGAHARRVVDRVPRRERAARDRVREARQHPRLRRRVRRRSRSGGTRRARRARARDPRDAPHVHHAPGGHGPGAPAPSRALRLSPSPARDRGDAGGLPGASARGARRGRGEPDAHREPRRRPRADRGALRPGSPAGPPARVRRFWVTMRPWRRRSRSFITRIGGET
ncbi:MAG: LLM class flavin-dependent oxidoreductase [Candidatus Rokubacteria bacterium]|nr:LLM class flavin-dependent oxidoreductase [Candidatus Rokubacteria bacterium]